MNVNKKWHFIDPEVTCVQTADGVLTLRQLFIPYFIEQLLMNLMGTVNTLVLGHYSDEAVAAVGAANQVISLVFSFYAVVSGGASIVISHRLGEGNRKTASDAAFAAIVTCTVLSGSVSAVLAGFSVPLMSLLNLSGNVLQMAVSYFRICISTSVLQGIILVVSAILRSYGRPRPAVAVSVMMNAINAVLNYLVVFRPSCVPLHGASGIAVSAVISRAVSLVMIIICLAGSRLDLDLPHKKPAALSGISNILKIGIPGGLSNLSYNFSQVVSTSILGLIGTVAISTKVYISGIVFYVYVVGFSMGLSTSILIGWMTGAGEYDKAFRLNQQVLKLTVLLNVSLSVCVYLFYRPLMGLFTANAQIIEISRNILFIDIFVELGRGFNHIENNSLCGAGDVIYPMTVSVISCWVMSILFSYILGIRLSLGLTGCWIAFMMDELGRGILLFARFRSKKWIGKKV